MLAASCHSQSTALRTGMDATTVYAIAVGSLALLWIMLTIGLKTPKIIYSYSSFYFSRYFSNRYLPRTLRGRTGATRIDFTMGCLYIAGNLVTLFVKGMSLKSVGLRAGYLALVNLVPLGLTGRPNILTDSCGISQRRQAQLHAAMGCMVTAHAIAHSAIALSQGKRSVPGYIVSTTFLCLGL